MLCVAAALPACGGAFAQSGEATFARQDMRLPLRALMASGELEKATGCNISGRMLGGGGDVIRAMASGDVQRVLSASNLLCTDIVGMGIIVIGVAAYTFDLLMRWAEPKRVPWMGRMSVARLAVCR